MILMLHMLNFDVTSFISFEKTSGVLTSSYFGLGFTVPILGGSLGGIFLLSGCGGTALTGNSSSCKFLPVVGVVRPAVCTAGVIA